MSTSGTPQTLALWRPAQGKSDRMSELSVKLVLVLDNLEPFPRLGEGVNGVEADAGVGDVELLQSRQSAEGEEAFIGQEGAGQVEFNQLGE